jgi:hypothetical protein
VCDHVEDAGEAAGGASGLNAQVRARLRHVQALDTVAVHAAASVLKVEPAAVDLGEVDEEASGEATVFADQVLELTDELCVGQRSNVLGQGAAAVRHIVLLGVFIYHGTLTVLPRTEYCEYIISADPISQLLFVRQRGTAPAP